MADPFCGRGTTALQANLLGRIAWVNDANPLATIITQAKTNPVPLSEVESFLHELDMKDSYCAIDSELLPFFHPQTLNELNKLRRHFMLVDHDTARFVQLIALSRLHGHSSGFFSAYSMPQLSVTPQAQRRINARRGEEPRYREVIPRLLEKSKAALKDGLIKEIRCISCENRYLTGDARKLAQWHGESVDLVVTSPPFLNKVNYLTDNWLEHWFLDINADGFKQQMMQTPNLLVWRSFIQEALQEISRILRRGGICVLEVGDIVHKGSNVNLDEVVIELIYENRKLRLLPVHILIQKQEFTKLAHCFSIENNKKGTNTQRILVLEKK